MYKDYYLVQQYKISWIFVTLAYQIYLLKVPLQNLSVPIVVLVEYVPCTLEILLSASQFVFMKPRLSEDM